METFKGLLVNHETQALRKTLPAFNKYTPSTLLDIGTTRKSICFAAIKKILHRAEMTSERTVGMTISIAFFEYKQPTKLGQQRIETLVPRNDP